MLICQTGQLAYSYKTLSINYDTLKVGILNQPFRDKHFYTLQGRLKHKKIRDIFAKRKHEFDVLEETKQTLSHDTRQCQSFKVASLTKYDLDLCRW